VDFVGELHAPSIHDLVERLDTMRKLGRLLHVDIIGHTVWSDHGRRLEHANRWGREERMDIEYKEQFQAVDPISPLLRGRPDPIPITALIDHKTLRRTRYFADFLMAHKVYPGVNMYLEDANGVMLDYRFGTSDPKKRFGSREVSILNLLRSHLINAHRLRQVACAHRDEAGLKANCPSFTLEALKAPRPNRKARMLLAGFERDERHTLYRMLSLLLHDSSSALQWNGFNLCLEHAGRAGNSKPAYVVHMLAHTIGSGAWLQQQFDLTLREGQVCHLLLKGTADKQIADMLNISYWTVRTHVGRVLEKLAIDSRSAIGLAVLNASHKASHKTSVE